MTAETARTSAASLLGLSTTPVFALTTRVVTATTLNSLPRRLRRSPELLRLWFLRFCLVRKLKPSSCPLQVLTVVTFPVTLSTGTLMSFSAMHLATTLLVPLPDLVNVRLRAALWSLCLPTATSSTTSLLMCATMCVLLLATLSPCNRLIPLAMFLITLVGVRLPPRCPLTSLPAHLTRSWFLCRARSTCSCLFLLPSAMVAAPWTRCSLSGTNRSLSTLPRMAVLTSLMTPLLFSTTTDQLCTKFLALTPELPTGSACLLTM
mmetsp:Transcript_421/g.1009  ORF Transcript_421/g.1009 Transcript_421/m.1009 type:complete len:263 (+) Transcript_421:12582-13370(+)